MQKMRKTAFRLQATSKKRWKRPAARERNAKNAKNSVSLTSDERKTEKVGLRGIPKGWNSEKQCFGMSRRVVFLKNELSGSPEASEFEKISFRGVPKLKKSEKQVFGESRSSKNLKNRFSGSPETYLSLKLQTYWNQNNPKRQEGGCVKV